MESAAKPTWARHRVMGFLCVLSFLTYFDRVCIMQAQEEIQRDLSLDDAAMSWVLGAFFLAYALFEMPGGWMAERFGARRTLTRIVLAWSLFTALSGSATGFLSLLAFRFLFGVGEAGAFPTMARVQATWLPARSRGYASGLIWLSARWGGALSPLIFGQMLITVDAPGFREFLAAVPGLSLIHDAAGWRISFWISGLLGVGWVAAFYPWFRDDPSAHPGVNQAEAALIRDGGGGAPPRHRHDWPIWRALLRSPSVWSISLLYFCVSFGWSFFVSWMPRYMKEIHRVEFADSRWGSVGPLFFGGVACLLGGYLSDRLIRHMGWKKMGRAIFPISGYLVAAAAMCSIRHCQTSGQAVTLLCVAGFFSDFGQGANWATIVDIGGRHAGIAAGFLNTVGNLAGFIAPRVGAMVFGTMGWEPLFALYALAYLLAAGMWIGIDPRRTFYEREPGPR